MQQAGKLNFSNLIIVEDKVKKFCYPSKTLKVLPLTKQYKRPLVSEISFDYEKNED